MRRFALLLLVPPLVALACGEALAPPQDAPPVDGGAESSPVADGSVDAQVDAGSGTFCATKPDAAWCEDFDAPQPVIEPGSSPPTLPEGTLATHTFVTGPRSFHFTVPAGLPPVQSTFLSKGFPGAEHLRIELDLRIAAAVPPAGDQAVQLLILKRYFAEAQLNRQCTSAADSGDAADCSWFVTACTDAGCNNIPIKSPKALTQWSHVVLDATFTESGGHVKFEEDGATVVDQAVDLYATGTPANEVSSASAAIVVFSGESTFIDVYVDNVVVDVR